MPKNFVRIVAFLLVPCLLAEPSLAAVPGTPRTWYGRQISTPFAEQAIQPSLIWVRSARSRGGFAERREARDRLVAERLAAESLIGPDPGMALSPAALPMALFMRYGDPRPYFQSKPKLLQFFMIEIFIRLDYERQEEVLRTLKEYDTLTSRWDFKSPYSRRYFETQARLYAEARGRPVDDIETDGIFQDWLRGQEYKRLMEIAGIEKAGQFLSTQKGWIPEGYREAFEAFQSDVIPGPESDVFATLERVYGHPLDELFVPLGDDMPGTALGGTNYLRRLNVGTVAETFFAQLRDGRKIALKVVTPTKRRDVMAGLRMLGDVARELDKRKNDFKDKTTTIRLSPIRFFEQFQQSCRRELYMDIEAEQAVQIARHLPCGFVMPKIYEDLTRQDVLAMDYIPAIKISALTSDLSRGKVIHKLIPAIVLQALCDGVFHSDPHPGNVYFLETAGVIVLFDFGQVGELFGSLRKDIVQLSVHIIQYHTKNKLLRALYGVAGFFLSLPITARGIRFVFFTAASIKGNRGEPKSAGRKKRAIKPRQDRPVSYQSTDADVVLQQLLRGGDTDKLIDFLESQGNKTERYRRDELRRHVEVLLPMLPEAWGHEQPFLPVDRLVSAAHMAGLILPTPYTGIVADIFAFVERYALAEKDMHKEAAGEQMVLNEIGFRAEVTTILRYRRRGNSVFAKLNNILLAAERFGFPMVSSAGMLIKALLEAEGVVSLLKAFPDVRVPHRHELDAEA